MRTLISFVVAWCAIAIITVGAAPTSIQNRAYTTPIWYTPESAVLNK